MRKGGIFTLISYLISRLHRQAADKQSDWGATAMSLFVPPPQLALVAPQAWEAIYRLI